MTCQHISRTWFGSALNLKILEQPISNLSDWIAHSILNLKEEVNIQIASILYNIWQARNQAIFDEKFIPEETIITRSSCCISEFLAANNPDPTQIDLIPNLPSKQQRKTHHKWIPPAPNYLKANSDANLQALGWWGLGAVVRNDEGLVMASASWRMKGSEDVILAETFALYRTIDLALDCGFRRIMFEVDNEQLVRLIHNDNSEDRSYLGKLII